MDILEKYVRRGRRTASRIYGRRAFILVMPRAKPVSGEKFFDLTPNGTYIWRLLADHPKLKDLISCFARKKKIKHYMAERQVVKFIKELIKEEIVDILDEPQKE